MADAFAALWNSSAPSKSDSPQKLGSAILSQTATRKPSQDVFSLLATSSAPNSRPVTPSMINRQVATKPPVATASGDAFSGLLESALGSTSQSGANLTIAERAALAEKAQREYLPNRQQSVKMQSSAWDGLDMLEKPLNNLHRDWDSGTLEPSKPTSDRGSLTKSQSQENDWDLSEFSSLPEVSTHSVPAHPTQAILDLDDFSLLTALDSHPPSKHHESIPSFDFPERLGSEDIGDKLLDEEFQDDNILGELGKPVAPAPIRPLLSNDSSRSSQRASNPSSRPVSPPPHILGQIVEMGFSVEQARVALASTSTGLDVEGALDTLLSNCAGAGSPPYENQRPGREDDLDARRRPPRSDPNSSSGLARERLNRTQETPSPSDLQPERNNHTEKLFSQASEIGLTVFNRANAFWNQSKEKVQKAYEERARGAVNSDPNQPTRPRWMQSSSVHENNADEPFKDTGKPSQDSPEPFKDKDHPASELLRSTRAVACRVEPQDRPRSQPKLADVYSDEPVAYVSPYRRGRPSQTQSTDSPGPPQSSSPKPPPRVSTPIKLTQRQTVSASQSMIASSLKYKTTGTDKLKLGQYAEAEAAYTAAMSALPASHLLLVPLYNNRALTRIKMGDCAGAVEDCNTIVSLIGPTFHPSREAKVMDEEDGASVDLGDGLVKAWKRRAEAYEGKEKWALAQADWESVAAAEWARPHFRSEAVRSAGQCRRMVAASSDTSPTPAARTSAKRKVVIRPPTQRGPTPPSEALSRLRDANDAAEVEDQARHELKDTVDSRLIGWKGGKETNIRALIASLDSVLWPGLGWQKVGMAELVTPSQVKVRYTKAISKLHPDKLNVNNTTLEQRMIANGVFGALNEAWNAFKQ